MSSPTRRGPSKLSLCAAYIGCFFFTSLLILSRHPSSSHPRHDRHSSSASERLDQFRRRRRIQAAQMAGSKNKRQMPQVSPGDFKGLQLLEYGDSPYQFGPWDNAPIVVTRRKLMFWTTPKVACTIFKKLFRRMEGYTDWDVEDNNLPHNPYMNGLNYLYHFKPAEADAMLTDPSWTRAIFVREPKERLLSAYLDKVQGNHSYYIRKHCCSIPTMASVLDCNRFRLNVPATQLKSPAVSFAEFLTVVYKNCMDPHWRPQAKRMPEKYWKQAINFVGHLDDNQFQSDVQRLLQQIGAWDEFGSMFEDNNAKHATSAQHNLQHYFTPELEQIAQEIHKDDYNHPQMGFEKG